MNKMARGNSVLSALRAIADKRAVVVEAASREPDAELLRLANKAVLASRAISAGELNLDQCDGVFIELAHDIRDLRNAYAGRMK